MAMCTRVDPSESVEILNHSWTSDLDPRVPPEKRDKGDFTIGKMLIDACKPFHWRDRFPMSNRFSLDMRAKVREKWRQEIPELVR